VVCGKIGVGSMPGFVTKYIAINSRRVKAELLDNTFNRRLHTGDKSVGRSNGSGRSGIMPSITGGYQDNCTKEKNYFFHLVSKNFNDLGVMIW